MSNKKSFRKISVGSDYMNAMHYQVGSFANRKKDLVISDIILDKDEYIVYVMKDNVCQEWKGFNKSAVCHYEYKLAE